MLRKAYQIVRNIIFSIVLTLAAIYVLLYVALSLPFVQNVVRDIACSELNKKTGGEFAIDHVGISPFNKLMLEGVSLKDPDGQQVATAQKIGVGIAIWRLILKGEIIITFGEIVELDARITQKSPDSKTNIQFLIDAFASKDKNKPPTRFDLQINNIVLRRCAVSFDKLWIPRLEDDEHFDANHLRVSNLSADMRIPVMRNDDFLVDLRRLSFDEASGLELRNLSGRFVINTGELSAENLTVQLPGSLVKFPKLSYKINGFKDIPAQLLEHPLALRLDDVRVTPSDLSCFLPALANYTKPLSLDLSAEYFKGTLDLERFRLDMPEGVKLDVAGTALHLTKPLSSWNVDISKLEVKADGTAIGALVTDFTTLSADRIALIRRVGDVTFAGHARGNMDNISFDGSIDCALGSAVMDIMAHKHKNLYEIVAEVSTPGFEVGRLLDNPIVGKMITKASVAGSVGKGVLEGHVTVDAPLLTFKDYAYSGIKVDVMRKGSLINGNISALDENVDLEINGEVNLQQSAPLIDIHGEVRTLRLSPLNLAAQYSDAEMSGMFDVSLAGRNLEDMTGYVDFEDIHFSNNQYKDLTLNHLRVESHRSELPYSLTLQSDLLDASIEGDYTLKTMPTSMMALAAHYLPSLVSPKGEGSVQDYKWQVKVHHDCPLLSVVKLPVTLLEDLVISGDCDTRRGTASMLMNVPYLQQGQDKLIRDTRLQLYVDTATNLCRLDLGTRIPNKKGPIDLSLVVNVANDSVHSDIGWDFNRQRAYRGEVSLTGLFGEKTPEGRPISVLVNPSQFEVNDTVWNIDPARLLWADKKLTAENVCVHRPGQMALINGVASADSADRMLITLKDIDLDYVFEALNINYVTFGGRASGELYASAAFSKTPVLRTDSLAVNNLTYNGCRLGDALIKSYFDNAEQSVHIAADVRDRGRPAAAIDGDIFVTRDSLSIGIAADSVNVSFLQPFMAAFSSAVEGRASGHVKLFGTFKDIDLIGRVHADTLRMKIDVTNTWYSASDSVIIDPGCINLTNITLRDREGHTALLNGQVRHSYFHDPTFDFAITDARNFLCYDTDASSGERWWGTIYGNGSGLMKGVPGYIHVEVDMASAPGSTFTFVLDDHEEAAEYEFITFTDRRKEAEELRLSEQLGNEPEEPEFLKRFRRRAEEQQQERPTRYDMSLRMRATPDAKVNIIMDPVAGDRIAATGSGALRMTYNSDDELNLYGTYTLDQGNYNFTLQDLIVRDFIIKEGSKISFNGNPLQALLSLTAAYRVNTSLTELDKSFATDRELNRTNVPVEALLKVDGQMQSPEITFDLDFPTLSADVASKVKSIISTSDMMNRQIIYLLALNRFYTPDYMNTSGNNNELASVASTTLSTQLGQMLGQLAPGWTFSPYFRTDKGDFSDMEVDLALSSALFNNRLLLNGNLGYRDRSTSNTTFVGDFDIEYLLNPSGTLRLKAYNHFNDQNYYLRSALTTQGLGIVFKRDFNRFLPGLFRRRKPKAAGDSTNKK